ncbi:MAG TPA: lanthionine synthetase C family protein [Cyclobacteriaceae bacterium]|nr:lanthionine synthetase C family protein [Cyclobacteriaceae bacterium]
MKDKVRDVLMAIDAHLQSSKLAGAGLLTGNAGVALFYNELYAFTGEERYLDICVDRITKSVDALGISGTPYSFCNGFAGVGWVVDRIMKSGIIEKSEELFDEIENKLFLVGRSEIQKGRYDFLHASGGVALLALSRLPRENAKKFLENFVRELSAVKTRDETGVKWKDLISENKDDAPIYGLGLSHGVPSVVMMLLKIFHAGICQEQIAPIVEKSVTWILSAKLESGKYNSVYPNFISAKRNIGPSRLSWCYGDLGLAIMFSFAGATFKNELWIQESKMLLQHSLTRLDPLQDPTLDAGVCHGTAGIAFLFKILGTITGNEDCYKVRDFWIAETLKFAKPGQNPLIKFYRPETDDPWIEKLGVLEGMAGVGLVLLDYLNGNSYSSVLKETLLLNLE